MPKHDVDVEIPQKAVLNTDVRFIVRSDGEKLGELLVSRGTLDWLPANFPSPPFSLSWEKFNELMQQQGRRRPR
jgi:hypothetical protein